jgi:CBS domain-containing protein
MKLSDTFTKKAIIAGPETTLTATAKLMKEHNVGDVVIVQDQRPIGIITDRDLALALGADGLSPQTPVHKVMSRRVLAIADDSSVFAATKFIREGKVRRLPIVNDEDRVVGMVSLDDLLWVLGRELFNLAEGIQQEMAVK